MKPCLPAARRRPGISARHCFAARHFWSRNKPPSTVSCPPCTRSMALSARNDPGSFPPIQLLRATIEMPQLHNRSAAFAQFTSADGRAEEAVGPAPNPAAPASVRAPVARAAHAQIGGPTGELTSSNSASVAANSSTPMTSHLTARRDGDQSGSPALWALSRGRGHCAHGAACRSLHHHRAPADPEPKICHHLTTRCEREFTSTGHRGDRGAPVPSDLADSPTRIPRGSPRKGHQAQTIPTPLTDRVSTSMNA